MYNAINDLGFAELLTLAQNLGDYMSGDGAQFYADLKDLGIMCNSFTTPYGYDTDGNRRTFPLPGMKYAYDIHADCMKAVLEKGIRWSTGSPGCWGFLESARICTIC